MEAATFSPQTIDLSASFVQLIRTALNNPKVTLDKTGLKSYDANGVLVTAINADGTAYLQAGLAMLAGVRSAGLSALSRSSQVKWVRQNDGAAIAQIYSTEGSNIAELDLLATAITPTDTDSVIQVTTQSGTVADPTHPTRGSAHVKLQHTAPGAGLSSNAISLSAVAEDGGGSFGGVLLDSLNRSMYVQDGGTTLRPLAIEAGAGSVTFTASNSSSTVTVAHNLGRTPQAVIALSDTAASFPQIPIFNSSARTNTTFNINAFAPGGAFTGTANFTWIAIG